jgi:hypothetical protein
MLTNAQMKYATERAEIPETDREPVLDVLRAELPSHGQVSDEDFGRREAALPSCPTEPDVPVAVVPRMSASSGD